MISLPYFTNKLMNERKKWCEICKMLVPFTRAAIVDHENSAKHKNNKSKSLKQQNVQSRKEKLRLNKAVDTIQQHQLSQSPIRWENDLHEKIQETQEQSKKVSDQLAFYGEGKIWILEKEDDTGKLRFRNTITGKIRYDKPIGLTLEDFEEEAWENAFSNFQGPEMKKIHAVRIGEWEVVKSEDTFLSKFRLQNESHNEQEPYQKNSPKIEERQQSCIKNNSINNTQLDFMKSGLVQGEKSEPIKLMTQKLLKLAEEDMDLSYMVPQYKVTTSGLFIKKNIKKSKQKNDSYD